MTRPDTDRCKGILAICAAIPVTEREYVHAAIEELEAARAVVESAIHFHAYNERKGRAAVESMRDEGFIDEDSAALALSLSARLAAYREATS